MSDRSCLFLDKENGCGRRPFVPEILGQSDPVPAGNADFQSIFARALRVG